MELRPGTAKDIDAVREIDGTIESTEYLHLEQAGQGLAVSWKLEPRPLRSKLIESNRLGDEGDFAIRQIACGADEGLVLVIEHEDAIVAAVIAQPRHDTGTLQVTDLRVDYEYRRQGLGTALIYRVIQEARNMDLRAVTAETRTNNFPANQFLLKSAFDLSGVDTRRHSNHDVVKETATLVWYASLD
jgi:ribosomal-protein-alanine N-acetyltransferase